MHDGQITNSGRFLSSFFFCAGAPFSGSFCEAPKKCAVRRVLRSLRKKILRLRKKN
jgi:hypothetical protein